MSGTEPQAEASEEADELSDRVRRLERLLHQEVKIKSALELELYEIKNSLAWRMVMGYRRLRNGLLGENSRRRKAYELTRDMLKGMLLLTNRKSSVPFRDMPYLASRLLQALWTEGVSGAAARIRNRIEVGYDYGQWIEKYDKLADADRAEIKRQAESLSYQPLISVVMPTFNTPEEWLRLAIESVRAQLYPNWELCIADDASSEPHVRRVLEEYRARDRRIKVVFRKARGHISAASNSALEIVEGDFTALLDHDDEVREHALYMVAAELNAHPDADLIYSDEDKIDEKGVCYGPYFKPDWNPTLLLAQNFVCHLAVFRTRTLREIGGFRLGYEGAQDWDLVMRVIERIPASHIRHIAHVLYHWRAVSGSTARGESQKKYALDAQRKTLEAHFERAGKKVEVLPTAGMYWRIKYHLRGPLPKVTLIIPSRNGFELLYRCVESIYRKTSYRNFDLLIVDNGSDEPKALDYLLRLEKEGRARILRYDAPFNFSAINNFAVPHAEGEIVGLLNNDLEVIAPDWLDEMVSYAIQPEIGAVGAKLYFPDKTIQHAGVILGLGGLPGVAGHAYKGRPRGYPGKASRALLAQNMSAVTAACLLVRRKVFEEVGGMDEQNLPIAFNDIDFCLRIREKGYRNVFTPFAELYHYESSSRGYEDTPEKVNRFEKESDFMKQRWGEALLNDPAYNPNLALDRDTFTLAFPPRAAKPWLSELSELSTKRRALL
jgi:GT2 family glycosyltransferase